MWLGLGAAAAAFAGAAASEGERQSLVVHATAYNSVPQQTNERPNLAAWGDVLEPGMTVIAVSRDLIEMGLRHGTLVSIEGLPGSWRVLDKMGKRWTRRIDLYMGEDIEAARRFGVRKVRISW
jgi:3D (Asp-Asp-Asp) domain-containing protein